MPIQYGFLITTSKFSSDAHEYVSIIEKRIILIDGGELAGLMLDHGLGVSTKQTYEINGLRIGNQHLLTFSHILGYFIGAKLGSNFTELNTGLRNLFKNERVFDFVKVNRKLVEFNHQIDFALLSTFKNNSQHKGPEPNNGFLKAQCIDGECVLLLGNNNSKCNPFAILPCDTQLDADPIEIPGVDEDKVDDTVDDHRPGTKF